MVALGVPAAQLLTELVEEVRAAETAGLDYCLVPEHHEVPSNALPDPLTVAGWLLAHTSRLTVGTGVLLLPLYHPIHVAEQAGILHAASGGRLILGLGAGYQEQDFAVFGSDRAARFEALEAGIETLMACWRGDAIEGHRVAPRLDTPPAIALGGASRAALSRAARLGAAWVSDPTYPLPKLETIARRYREQAAAAGTQARTIVLRELWIGESDAEARATYGPAVEAVFRYYLNQGALHHLTDVTADQITLDRALREVVICGSLETVCEEIAELVARTEADACVFMLRHPDGPLHAAVCEVIARLGAEVAPRLARRECR
jgi:alkanesulfonate monooxygenase SsuD/methylene tetrahydromethanopterin reductase-like flavin-dependent oxidoreductase (luciferase family)